jgi:hypothetical protein
MTVTRTFGDHTLTLPNKVADAAEMLAGLRPGGIATIHGYRTEVNSKTLVPSLSTIQFISRFSYARRNERIHQMLCNLEAKSVDLTGVDASLFDEALSAMRESARKTLEGDRDDAHRQAHDNLYAGISHGVKVHMETTMGAEGRKVLVVDSETGLPRFDSLLISALILAREYHEAGEKKVVKSRPLTLVKERIQKVINETFKCLVTLKLTNDNFEALSMGGTVTVPESIWSEGDSTDE